MKPQDLYGGIEEISNTGMWLWLIMYISWVEADLTMHGNYCPMYPVSWSFTNMDGTCSNKSRAWREKKLWWLNVSAPQRWSHVVTVSQFGLLLQRREKETPNAAVIAINTTFCNLFAGHDPEVYLCLLFGDEKRMCSGVSWLGTCLAARHPGLSSCSEWAGTVDLGALNWPQLAGK